MSDTSILWGATLEISDTDGGSFTSVPEAKGIAVPTAATDYQDVTSLDSAGGFREFIPGLRDSGEITVPCNYTSDGYDAARTHQESRALRYFKSTMPTLPSQTSGDVFECAGFVTAEITNTDDLGAPLMFNYMIRISGQASYTKGTDAT